MPKELVKGLFAKNKIITEESDAAKDLNSQSVFGTLVKNKVELSLFEAVYLVEKERLEVLDGRNNPIILDRLLKKAKTGQKYFWVNYAVYKDMRDRGYIVKTALKFGANFRVYDRGVKPGEDHARWILYPVHESDMLTWHEFAAKNRVAHSTKKRLLIGVVDDEAEVSYWEVRWLRP
jgi:tRNA-intron endonuclease, archaea type